MSLPVASLMQCGPFHDRDGSSLAVPIRGEIAYNEANVSECCDPARGRNHGGRCTALQNGDLVLC